MACWRLRDVSGLWTWNHTIECLILAQLLQPSVFFFQLLHPEQAQSQQLIGYAENYAFVSHDELLFDNGGAPASHSISTQTGMV